VKKIIIFLCLLTLPLIGYAKYCPSCLNTFQAQTVHGQTELLFQWLMKVMNPKYPLKQQDIKHLFDKNASIIINGHRVARGFTGIRHYLVKIRRYDPLLEFKLRQLLVDQKQTVIAYQLVSKRRRHKYRSVIIAILEFKGSKLLYWWSVAHTTRIN